MSQDDLTTEANVDAVNWVIPQVRELGAYTLKATEARIKLNQNESPVDLPAPLKERVMAKVSAATWNRYPDFHPADVLEGLGRMHGLPGESVLIGNGSNELIQAIFGAIVGPGVKVAFPIPTFSLYKMMVAANEGEAIQVPLNADLSFDLAALTALADEGEAHLLLCTPNNPTGTALTLAQITDLAERTPRLVIVDEAYGHFNDVDASALVSTHPNVIVLRTFSKALGLAGVRFGYALAHPALATQLSKVKLPYNVGVFGLEVARALLDNPQVADEATQLMIDERERVALELGRSGVDHVYPSSANFVLFKTRRALELFEFLYEKGILIRNVGHYPMLDNCLRVSIGDRAQNDEFLSTLNAFFNAGG